MKTKVLLGLAVAAVGALALLGNAAVHAQGPPPPPPGGDGFGGPPPPLGGDNFGGPPPPPPGEDFGGPPPPPPPGGDDRGRELMQQVMVARLSKELELSDEETVLLVRRFLDFKDAGKALRKERGQLTRDLRDLVEGGDAKAAEIETKLSALIESDQKIADAKRDLYGKLSQGLSPLKKAKLYVFLQQFESDLRRMADEVRGHHRGPDEFGRGPGRDFRPGDGPPPDERGMGKRFDRRFEGDRPGRSDGPGRQDGPGRPMHGIGGRGGDGPPPPPPPPQRTPDEDPAADDALIELY